MKSISTAWIKKEIICNEVNLFSCDFDIQAFHRVDEIGNIDTRGFITNILATKWYLQWRFFGICLLV